MRQCSRRIMLTCPQITESISLGWFRVFFMMNIQCQFLRSAHLVYDLLNFYEQKYPLKNTLGNVLQNTDSFAVVVCRLHIMLSSKWTRVRHNGKCILGWYRSIMIWSKFSTRSRWNYNITASGGWDLTSFTHIVSVPSIPSCVVYWRWTGDTVNGFKGFSITRYVSCRRGFCISKDKKNTRDSFNWVISKQHSQIHLMKKKNVAFRKCLQMTSKKVNMSMA